MSVETERGQTTPQPGEGRGGALGKELTVTEAVDKAQQEAAGKVLSAATLLVENRKVYRIKILTEEGSVRVIQIPAAR